MYIDRGMTGNSDTDILNEIYTSQFFGFNGTNLTFLSSKNNRNYNSFYINSEIYTDGNTTVIVIVNCAFTNGITKIPITVTLRKVFFQ